MALTAQSFPTLLQLLYAMPAIKYIEKIVAPICKVYSPKFHSSFSYFK